MYTFNPIGWDSETTGQEVGAERGPFCDFRGMLQILLISFATYDMGVERRRPQVQSRPRLARMLQLLVQQRWHLLHGMDT